MIWQLSGLFDIFTPVQWSSNQATDLYPLGNFIRDQVLGMRPRGGPTWSGLKHVDRAAWRLYFHCLCSIWIEDFSLQVYAPVVFDKWTASRKTAKKVSGPPVMDILKTWATLKAKSMETSQVEGNGADDIWNVGTSEFDYRKLPSLLFYQACLCEFKFYWNENFGLYFELLTIWSWTAYKLISFWTASSPNSWAA